MRASTLSTGRTHRRPVLARSLALLALATAAACGEGGGGTGPGQPEPVARVDVHAPVAEVDAGATVQLTAVPRAEDGAALPGRAVAWTSSDHAVATVSAAGLVTAHAAGTAVISATSEGRSGQKAITVRAVTLPVASVEIAPGGSAEPLSGTTLQLAAVAKAADGTPLPGRAVAWTTSDDAVARVSAAGVLQAREPGTAIVTATIEGRSAQLIVFVRSLVAWVDLDPRAAAIAAGEVLQLNAQPRGENGIGVNRPVTWTSSNPGVASVNASGRVTGHNVGTVVVTAASDGKSASAHVVVSTWTTRALQSVNANALPAPLYTVTENGAALEVLATGGVLQTLAAGSRYQMWIAVWLRPEGGVPVQATIGVSGSYLHDLGTGTYVFSPGDGTAGFVGRPLPNGKIAVTWRPRPGVAEATLTFAAPAP